LLETLAYRATTSNSASNLVNDGIAFVPRAKNVMGALVGVAVLRKTYRRA